MRDVAVIGFAEAPNVRRTDATTNGVEMLVPIFRQVFDQTGLTRADICFWCSGSSDYLAGRAFSCDSITGGKAPIASTAETNEKARPAR